MQGKWLCEGKEARSINDRFKRDIKTTQTWVTSNRTGELITIDKFEWKEMLEMETMKSVTSISYIGGPRISFKAWKSIKIGISGGRARSAVSLMDSVFASSVT